LTNKYLEKVADESRRKAFGLGPKNDAHKGYIVEAKGKGVQVSFDWNPRRKAREKFMGAAQEVPGAAKVHAMPKPPGRLANFVRHPVGKALMVGAGIGGAYALHKSMSKNKYHQKAAQLMSAENKKDLVNTGIIGAMGGLTATATDMIVNKHVHFNPKHFAIGTGLGLAGDYAALKMNKGINKKIDETDKVS